jgi:hypothetical protein
MGETYYEPSEHGEEAEVGERLRALWEREPDDGV